MSTKQKELAGDDDVPIGKAARYLRKRLGLTQRAMADRVGITWVHLCNIENGHSNVSLATLAAFREQFDVDLYVIAWCKYGNTDGLPKKLRLAAAALGAGWDQHIERAIAKATA